MGWETRKRGGLYYTRSRRKNGRVVREYIGAGLVGQVASLWDEQTRFERATKAREWQAEQARMRETDRPLEELSLLLNQIYRGALLIAGYRQHHRGEWRKRRG